jgi:hypothetical protein
MVKLCCGHGEVKVWSWKSKEKVSELGSQGFPWKVACAIAIELGRDGMGWKSQRNCKRKGKLMHSNEISR